MTSVISQKQVVDIVSKLIEQPSYNPGSDEYGVSEYIKSFMEKLDIEVTLVPIVERRTNVIARLKGDGSAAPLAFTGHMDVVPVNDTELQKWITKPFVPNLIDGQLYGRGAADMKGGLGAAMAAMQAIRLQGIVPPGDVLLIATVDEEDVMRGAKELITTNLLDDVKHLVICEPSDMQLMCCCRGRTWADITLLGESGHASIQGNGNNTIVHAATLIQALDSVSLPCMPHPLLGNVFWQSTVIHGGVEPAMVPDTCVVTVDARLIPGTSSSDIWDAMHQLLERLHAENNKFEATVNIIEEREAWETPVDHPLTQLAIHSYKAIQLPVTYGGASYTTDGAYLGKLGMNMIIIGPGDIALAHRHNEAVPVIQLQQAAELYYQMILNNNLK